MSDKKLENIINKVSENMASKFSTPEKITERTKDLADDDGKISAAKMSVLVMGESISYTRQFAYELIKELKEEKFFSDID